MKRIAKDVGIGIITTIILSIIQNVSEWVINTASANRGQIGISIANAVFYRSANRSYTSILHYAAGIIVAFIIIIILIACFVHAMIVMNKTRKYKKELSKEDEKSREKYEWIRAYA